MLADWRILAFYRWKGGSAISNLSNSNFLSSRFVCCIHLVKSVTFVIWGLKPNDICDEKFHTDLFPLKNIKATESCTTKIEGYDNKVRVSLWFLVAMMFWGLNMRYSPFSLKLMVVTTKRRCQLNCRWQTKRTYLLKFSLAFLIVYVVTISSEACELGIYLEYSGRFLDLIRCVTYPEPS